MTSEEKKVFGERALEAGMEICLGMRTIYGHIVVAIGKFISDDGIVSSDVLPITALGYDVKDDVDAIPDLTDPGTEGHALAQISNRVGLDVVVTEDIHASMNESWKVVPRCGRTWPGRIVIPMIGRPSRIEAVVSALEVTK
jgi:hypothetical protein